MPNRRSEANPVPTMKYVADSLRAEPELPDIVTFAEDSLGKRLFPAQRTILRVLYPFGSEFTSYDEDLIEEWRALSLQESPNRFGLPNDIWTRIEWLKANNFRHFKEILFIGGRRAGKGVIGGIIGAYENYRLCRLGNPQAHYGLEEGLDLHCFVNATTERQAQDYQFAELYNTIIDAPCFHPYISTARENYVSLRTPADSMRLQRLEKSGIPIDREVASIRNIPRAANSRAGRGSASFALIFDEHAHMLTGTDGPGTDRQVYGALKPALNQLGRDGIIYIPTSPGSINSNAYNLYSLVDERREDGFPMYPEMVYIQLAAWMAYRDADRPLINAPKRDGKIVAPLTPPYVYDDQARREQQKNPRFFDQEIKSQWLSGVENSYFDPKMIDAMFEPFETAEGWRRVEPGQTGLMVEYFGYADPAETRANYAVAIGHVALVAQIDEVTGEVVERPHYFIDWMNVWLPTGFPDGQIDFDVVEQQIVAKVRSDFPTLVEFKFDQFANIRTIRTLERAFRDRRLNVKVRREHVTARSNLESAERFARFLNMKRIHTYRDDLFDLGGRRTSRLELELKNLEWKDGKIAKQEGGVVRTDDLADAVIYLVNELWHYNEARQARRSIGGLAPTFGSTIGDQSASARRGRSAARTTLERHRGVGPAGSQVSDLHREKMKRLNQ